MAKTTANTPTQYYLDTPVVKKACREDFDKINKECKPDNDPGKNKHLALNKLLGKKTMERLEALSKKVKGRHESNANNAWMSHCDGLWIKPVGGEEALAEFRELIGEASRDLDSAIKTMLEPLVEQIKHAMTDKALDMAGKKAAVFAAKTGIRHTAALAGAAVGGVGALVTEAAALVWTIGDFLYTGYEVVASGFDIYAAVNEISSALDIAQRAQKELAELANVLQNKSPTDIMASGMGILSRLNPCTRARRCQLVPFGRTDTTSSLSGKGCCPGQTGHHVIPRAAADSCPGYNHDKAPTICVEGVNNTNGTHGKIHAVLDKEVRKYKEEGWFGVRDTIGYEDIRDLGIKSVKKTFPESGCDEKCLRAQLDAYYKDLCGNTKMTPSAGMPDGERGADVDTQGAQ
ncbi:MAG: hypothetical protein LBF61_03670 [Azoarcus sp.]|jgi:hypothetical protein|nr:hypothetical protein [Azoarcus sp.]